MALPAQQPVYRFGGFVLDPECQELRSGSGERVPLRSRSLALLLLLAENSGRLVSRETIMEALWPHTYVIDDSITQCVLDIRRALGERRRSLRTIRRRGYILDLDVERADRRPATHRPDNVSPVQMSVLVLRLRSHNGSDAHERLAESITADIITGLTTHLNDLAPGQAQVQFHDDRLAQWRHAPADCQADYVLRGTVHGGVRAQVNLQLLAATSGACIWAQRCDRRDLLPRLVHAASISLVADVGRRIEALPTQAVTLSDLLGQGHAWLLRPASPFNCHHALACFEQALMMDPESMSARLGIASGLVRCLAFGWGPRNVQNAARAEDLLLDVLHAGTAPASAHYLNGTLRRLQGRLEESRVELEMAADLMPRYADTYGQLGMTLVFRGQPDTALACLEKAVQMAPEHPQAPVLHSNLACCLVLLGRLDAAIHQIQKAAIGNPQLAAPPVLLAAALGLQSKAGEASAPLGRAMALSPALGSLSARRKWVSKQAEPGFMPIYDRTIELGLRRAGMPET